MSSDVVVFTALGCTGNEIISGFDPTRLSDTLGLAAEDA